MEIEKNWLDDHLSLFRVFKIIPNSEMNKDQKFNALTRLVLLIAGVMFFLNNNYWLLFLTLTLTTLIILFCLTSTDKELNCENYTPIEDEYLTLDDPKKNIKYLTDLTDLTVHTDLTDHTDYTDLTDLTDHTSTSYLVPYKKFSNHTYSTINNLAKEKVHFVDGISNGRYTNLTPQIAATIHDPNNSYSVLENRKEVFKMGLTNKQNFQDRMINAHTKSLSKKFKYF